VEEERSQWEGGGGGQERRCWLGKVKTVGIDGQKRFESMGICPLFGALKAGGRRATLERYFAALATWEEDGG
jgi:hypothetical protein